MNRRAMILAAMAGLTSGPLVAQQAADGVDENLRIGGLKVDRESRSFRVQARFIPHPAADVPMEFLIVPFGAAKSYESLIEVMALPSEFNVACLLIGLDPANGVPGKGVFDPTPAQGDPVALDLVWQDDSGTEHSAPISEFMQIGEGKGATDDWVYAGSFLFEDGAYAADVMQLIVGFSHDPESIIQHGAGLGLDQYGMVQMSPKTGEIPALFELRVSALPRS
ncbi:MULTISPECIES: YdjY domain-containing protein [unclassified Marinovum]